LRTWLGKKIIKAFDRNELIGVIIFGNQRVGKSTYAMKILYDLYGDWDKVLDVMTYRLDDILEILKKSKDDPLEAFAIDDAGVHTGYGSWFTNRELAVLLQQMFDVAGIGIGGILLTTPTISHLLAALRRYNFYRVKITKISRWKRVAHIYKKEMWMRREPGRELVREYFNCRIPDDVYQRYVKIRLRYLDDVIQRLEKVRDRLPPRARVWTDSVVGMRG